MWYLSTVLYVGSMRLTYNTHKIQERLDCRFEKPENKQLDRSCRARGESAAMSTMIGCFFLSSIDDESRERMAKEFDLWFMIVKGSLLFTKYPVLLELESCHGVDLGSAYRMPDSANISSSYTSKSQCQTFLNILSSSG